MSNLMKNKKIYRSDEIYIYFLGSKLRVVVAVRWWWWLDKRKVFGFHYSDEYA